MPGWNPPGSAFFGQGPEEDVANDIAAPFISASTTVYTPLVQSEDVEAPFITAATNVYTPTLEVAASARISQEAVEAVVQPVPQARISQQAVEAVVSPTNVQARVSQIAVEVVVEIINPKARFSQIATEVVIRNSREWIHISIVD